AFFLMAMAFALVAMAFGLVAMAFGLVAMATAQLSLATFDASMIGVDGTPGPFRSCLPMRGFASKHTPRRIFDFCLAGLVRALGEPPDDRSCALQDLLILRRQLLDRRDEPADAPAPIVLLEERSAPRRASIDWWGNLTFALGLVFDTDALP